jgi:hypothetical protein
MSLEPVGCGSRFTPIDAPIPDLGWQQAQVRVSIRTRGPPWAPVYSPCTTILGPKARWHPKPAPKPAGTRNPPQNPRAPETRPETRGHSMADALSKPTGTRNRPETRRVRVQVSTHGCGCGFSPISILGRGGFLVNLPRTLPVAIPTRGEGAPCTC